MNNFQLINMRTAIVACMACTYSLNFFPLEAQSATPPPTRDETVVNPDEQHESLDLSFVYGGDFTHGESYSETEIVEKLLSYSNLVELNLSGQSLTPALMEAIHDYAP